MTTHYTRLSGIGSGLALILSCLMSALSESSAQSNIQYATTLSQEGNHPAAALEFRRLAMTSTTAWARASFYWAAAYEYGQAGQASLADKMLGQAENDNPGMTSEALLLRGQHSLSSKDWPEAEFYFQGLTQGTTQPVARLASRSLAVTRLRQHHVANARDALALSPVDEREGRRFLDLYAEGRDKSPRIGGLLGLIPGMGYAYSGEYANAGRSLILNSLFIFGMVDTAKKDQWGAFTAISFFEATWYSGSIYGGIDAAERYNQNRLDQCAAGITGAGKVQPDYSQLPILTLRFKF